MSKRSAQGGGSIRLKKPGLWEGRYTVGRDPGTGEQVQKSVYGKTQREVRMKLQQVTTQIDEGSFIEPSRLTVAQWLEIWQADYLGSVKPGTVSNYSQQVKNHVIPALGAVKITALDTTMIQRLYNKARRNGLSPKTIKNLHGVLHKALQVAVRVGYLRVNPSDACVLPRIVEPEIEPLDIEEITKFSIAMKGHPYEVLFKVALLSGMRSGELLGLTWDCVRFDTGTIYVYRQLVPPRLKGSVYAFGTLKNDKPRSLTPAPYVMQLLKERRHAQIEQRLLAGDVWDEGRFKDLVFTNEFGKHLTQSGVWKMLQTVLEKAEIGHRRFHDLRHSYAVNSLRSGDDIKTLQENLGHHTASFTLDKYGHVTESMKRESAARMEAFIKGIPEL